MTAAPAKPTFTVADAVEALDDHRTRPYGIRTLRGFGPASIPALVDASRSPNHGVAWVATRLLGEIGTQDATAAKPAIARLESLVDDDSLGTVARDALRALGVEASDAPDQSTARPAEVILEGGEVPATADDVFVDAAVALITGATVEANRNRFVVSLLLNGETCALRVTFESGPDGEATVVVAADLGAPADPARYAGALAANRHACGGALAVEDAIAGSQTFVCVAVHARRTFTPGALTLALVQMAAALPGMADQVRGDEKAE